MGTVSRLPLGKEAVLVDGLERIKALARAKHAKGIMFVLACAGGEHEVGMLGTYRDRPEFAIEVATGALEKLHRYEARKKIDPLTATDFIRDE